MTLSDMTGLTPVKRTSTKGAKKGAAKKAAPAAAPPLNVVNELRLAMHDVAYAASELRRTQMLEGIVRDAMYEEVGHRSDVLCDLLNDVPTWECQAKLRHALETLAGKMVNGTFLVEEAIGNEMKLLVAGRTVRVRVLEVAPGVAK